MRSSDWSSDVGSSDLAAIGGFVIGNPKSVLKRTGKGFGKMLKGPKYGKKNYVELLSLLYLIFKLAKTKGMLALETHVEKPDESGLFAQFPSVTKDHHVLEFLCDYLRMMTLGPENRSAEHTSELQSLMRISYAVFCSTKSREKH